METLEGNRLIAKFTGANNQVIPKGGLHGYKEGQEIWFCLFDDHPDATAVENLMYEVSFDWLMPVGKKCREVLDDMKGENVVNGFAMLWAIYEACQKFDISILWQSIINFIKWYNHQNQQQ